MSVNNVVYGDTTVPLQLTFFFYVMQIKPHSELTQVEKKSILSATLTMSSPLENRFSFIFAHEKGLGHMSQK